MEPNEDILRWLEAGEAADYRAGVLLLQDHSRNRGLVNNLLKKESATNREKLTYELVKIGCGHRMEDVSEVLNHFAQATQGALASPVQQVASVLTGQDFPAQPEPERVPEQLRPQVDELTQLMSKLYNQRVQLSNSLADLPAAEGPRVVGEILSLQNQYNALAEKRRRVLGGEPLPAEQPAPGAEPPAAEAAPVAPTVDKADLLQRRQNLRSNISKGKKRAAEAKTEAKQSEYAQKVAQWEVELQTVDMQLALPQA
ncbi:MAG: hypothetical protein ACRYFX_08660 [Janthinobacterium lividum]